MQQLFLNKCLNRSKKQNKIWFEGFFYKGLVARKPGEKGFRVFQVIKAYNGKIYNQLKDIWCCELASEAFGVFIVTK